jgi:DNA polymerase-3 subunit delta'
VTSAGSGDDALLAPRENPFLVGHTDAEEILVRLVAQQRLPNALLLTGPEGIGKATLAYRLARYIFITAMNNGQNHIEFPDIFGDEPKSVDNLWIDQNDPVFHRVASGGHVDLITVERQRDASSGKQKSAIAVDAIRAIPSFFAHTSGEGGWRIAIIDPADDMNVNAANALLKILEEPPERSMLILVSHRPDALLRTIQSRCWRLALRPLGDDTVRDLLSRYAPTLSDDERDLAVKISAGSIGRALRLVESEVLAIYRQFLDLLADPARMDGEKLHNACGAAARLSDAAAYSVITDLLRDWCLAGARSAALDLGARDGSNAEIMEAQLDRWVQLWDKCDRLLNHADQLNMDRKQVLLTVFLGLRGSLS